MRLDSVRLLIRHLRRTDANDVFDWTSNPVVPRYMAWSLHHSVEDAAQFINWSIELYSRKSRAAPLGVELKETGCVIGTCAFCEWHESDARAEGVFAMSPAHWGKGLMTEALTVLINHGFSQGLYRIQATVELANERSRALLKRVGFKFEGNLRGYMQKKPGAPADVEMFALLRPEWKTS